jgi:hypothetical protein
MITADDRHAVNDLFEFVDLKGLDDRANATNQAGLPPIKRGFETYLHFSTHGGRTVEDIVDSLRMTLRKAWEEGFELANEDVSQAFYLATLHRGDFYIRVTAPSEVAVFGPLLTFEPREAVTA